MIKDELIQKIKNANAAYSSGMPYLTDVEYDELWQQLHSLDPYNKVLYHTARDPKLGQNIHPHLYKIKGTHKAFNQKDLIPYLQRFGSRTLILEPKYDGCAAVLYRQQEGHYKLILEGDGSAGRDITHHLKKMILTFFPLAINSVELIIRCEDWKDSYGSNPRNTVAGWLARKELPHSITIVPHNKSLTSIKYTYDGNIENFSELLLSLHNKWKATYPIDGIMIKVKDSKLRLTSDTHPDVYQWSLAWKPPIQTAETIVTDIEWNVSRKGRIIPTVIYEPVELCNTINSRATGNNAQWIRDRKLVRGAKIIVGKAGEIIPKIISVNSSAPYPSLIPEQCPVCGMGLLMQDKHLICTGNKCLPQLIKSLHYFYSDKGMDLKSIGEHMIADLIDNPLLYKILIDKPWALLSPEEFKIKTMIVNIWGEKRTSTYIHNLKELNNTKNLCHFISALGKPGLAYKTALKIYHALKGHNVKSYIPSKAIKNFVDTFLLVNQVSSQINFTFLPVPQPPKMIYCITGTLTNPRNEMISYLEKYQWQISNQISKFVNILIVGDEPGRIKITKAKELNIKTISESELLNNLTKEI